MEPAGRKRLIHQPEFLAGRKGDRLVGADLLPQPAVCNIMGKIS